MRGSRPFDLRAPDTTRAEAPDLASRRSPPYSMFYLAFGVTELARHSNFLSINGAVRLSLAIALSDPNMRTPTCSLGPLHALSDPNIRSCQLLQLRFFIFLLPAIAH